MCFFKKTHFNRSINKGLGFVAFSFVLVHHPQEVKSHLGDVKGQVSVGWVGQHL